MERPIDSCSGADPGRAALDLVKGPFHNALKELEFCSKQLPADQDFHFYSNFPEFKDSMADIQSRVVSLMSQLGSLEAVRSNPSKCPAEFDDSYDWLVRAQDDFLDRVNASLDKFYLERKDREKQDQQDLNAFESTSRKTLSSRKASSSPPVRSAEETRSGSGSGSGSVKAARGSKEKATVRSRIPFHIPRIPRPQDKFDDAVDNSNTPFKHQAPPKGGGGEQDSQAFTPNAMTQASSFEDIVSIPPIFEVHARKIEDHGVAGASHPLKEKLTKMGYLKALPSPIQIGRYASLRDTPFTFVKTVNELKEMAVKLRVAGEIAVDLENHHYRSFQGFVCLMQVSTRYEDFLVDTLDLRSHIGPCLGEIFSDPSIEKVMHGADHDIVWLQRDFGIYVCSLFDTGQAARVLHLQSFGLAFLLEHFCGVHADKRYQLADWRIRPLPSEMIKYAREDTHYLLYVYDMLRQGLLDARAKTKGYEEDPVFQVYKRSRDICLQLYAKEIFTETSYKHLYGLLDKNFRPDQLAAVAGLYAWRDKMARIEDESTGYVLPNHLLFQLASEMPDNVRQLQNLVKGSHSMVTRHGSTVVEIIHKARESALMDSRTLVPGSSTVKKLGDEIEEGEITRMNQQDESEDVPPKTASEEPHVEVVKRDFRTSHVSGNLGHLKANEAVQTVATGSTQGVPSAEEELVKQPSETCTGPVLVSRKLSSSFFGGRPSKAPLVPLPSPHLSTLTKHAKTSEEQHLSPAALSPGPTMPASNISQDPRSPDDSNNEVMRLLNRELRSDHAAGPAVTNTEAGTHVPIIGPQESADERLPPDRPTETKAHSTTMESQTCDDITEHVEAYGLRSDSAPETAGTSLKSQQPGSSSILSREAMLQGSVEMPSGVPRNTPMQSNENCSDTNADVHLANESADPSSVGLCKDSESAQLARAPRKASKLGALLGGRARVQQIGSSPTAGRLEQEARAKIVTPNLEFSLVLPLSTRAPPSDVDVSQYNVQVHSTKAGADVGHGVSTEGMNVLNESGQKETGEPSAKSTPENDVCSTAPEWPDVVMLEDDCQDPSPSGEGEKVLSPRKKESERHRGWWPGSADVPTDADHDGDSHLCAPGGDSDEAPEQLPDDSEDGSRHLPPSLSEMCRTTNRGKERRRANHSGSDPNSQVGTASKTMAHDEGRRKKIKSNFPNDDGFGGKNVVRTDKEVGFRNFNYREARKALGVDHLHDDDPREGRGMSNRRKDHGRGRGRGSNGANIPGSRLSRSAFDHWRRARAEPRPDGIPAGQRRQVFPQTGNCTAVFKR